MKSIHTAKGAWGAFFAALAIACMAGCAAQGVAAKAGADIQPGITKLIDDHTLSVAVIYGMSEEEWQKRRAKSQMGQAGWNDITIDIWQQIIPLELAQETPDGKPIRYIAYIGSASLLADNYALTVSHLFAHEENTYGYQAWVFKKSLGYAIGAELVAQSDYGQEQWNDYAIIRVKADLRLPGVRIARAEPPKHSRVIYSGTIGGLAFFARTGRITTLGDFFQRGDDGLLHLSRWHPFDFWTILGGGPGDSGGGVFDAETGELIGVLYCGLTVHGQNVIFFNPLEYLRKFLFDAGLAELGK